jgi:septum site-determining protein MinC
MLKGVNGGVLITIKDIKQDLLELEEKLNNKEFFGKNIDFLLKEKDKEYYKDILELMERYDHNLYLVKFKEIKVDVPTKKEKKNNDALNSDTDNAGETYVIKRTIRSGQRIDHPGNVVIIGDLNPGAEVIAGGDVYIFGRARGVIHAGRNGDPKSIILALSLEVNQIRIGNVFTKGDGQKPRPGVAERAYLTSDNKIIVEEYKYL